MTDLPDGSVDGLTDMLNGVAGLLTDAGIAVLAEDGDVYQPGDVAISFLEVPPDPDDVLVLSGRVLQLDPLLGNGLVSLQVRQRTAGPYRTLTPRSAAVIALFAGRRDVMLGGLHVWLFEYASGGPLGLDDNTPRRPEHEDTFLVHCDWPTTYRFE